MHIDKKNFMGGVCFRGVRNTNAENTAWNKFTGSNNRTKASKKSSTNSSNNSPGNLFGAKTPEEFESRKIRT